MKGVRFRVDSLFGETQVGQSSKTPVGFPIVLGMYDSRFAMAWQGLNVNTSLEQVVLRFARLQGEQTP